MTNQPGAPAAPYDESTFPRPGLAISLDAVQSLNEWLFCPEEHRAALFYFYNLSLRNYPPGAWLLVPNVIAAMVGVPVDMVESTLLRGWYQAEDGRFYHPALVEIVRKDIAKREKGRERVARHRDKGTRKRKPVKNDARARIPYADIIGLYNEILPNNPECLELSDARRTRIRTLWNGDLSDLDRWRNFFVYVSGIPFLTGKESSQGRKAFRPNIDWITKPENYLKIKERGYE